MDKQTLWIGGYGPEESAHGHGLATIRRVLERETNGDIRVDITWNVMDEGRPNTDLLELVESGEMFLCYFSTSYLAETVPELNILEVPFLFADLESAHEALDGDLGRSLQRAVGASTRFVALGFWDNGFRHLTNRHHPVRAPADVAGMTVRLQPNSIHEELIRSWGGTPVAAELSRGLRLIKELDVDAQENPLANTVAYGVDRIHPHVTMTGHLYGARGIFAHAPTYDSLPDSLRNVVDEAVRSAVFEQRAFASKYEISIRSRLEASGIQFVDLDEDERRMFAEASSPAVALAREEVPVEMFDLVPA